MKYLKIKNFEPTIIWYPLHVDSDKPLLNFPRTFYGVDSKLHYSGQNWLFTILKYMQSCSIVQWNSKWFVSFPVIELVQKKIYCFSSVKDWIPVLPIPRNVLGDCIDQGSLELYSMNSCQNGNINDSPIRIEN